MLETRPADWSANPSFANLRGLLHKFPVVARHDEGRVVRRI
jgi:hypothetical protein